MTTNKNILSRLAGLAFGIGLSSNYVNNNDDIETNDSYTIYNNDKTEKNERNDYTTKWNTEYIETGLNTMEHKSISRVLPIQKPDTSISELYEVVISK